MKKKFKQFKKKITPQNNFNPSHPFLTPFMIKNKLGSSWLSVDY